MNTIWLVVNVGPEGLRYVYKAFAQKKRAKRRAVELNRELDSDLPEFTVNEVPIEWHR